MLNLIITILFLLQANLFTTLLPNASLPTVESCVQQVSQSPTPETAPWNQPYNTPPIEGIPSYFYQYAPCCTELPNKDFQKVDGNYSGSTNDLIRITACKWGIDENYIRAQAWIESGWHQDCAAEHGGIGCEEGGDLNNPPGNPQDLPITPITPNGVFFDFDGFGHPTMNSTDHYDSWGMLQNKVYYDWETWPMIEESTSFSLDFRFAEMRGCMNGDQYPYFNYQSHKGGKDYQNAVIAAKKNPNKKSKNPKWTNLQYLAYGCIDTHFTGDWFNGKEDEYLQGFLNALNNNSSP